MVVEKLPTKRIRTRKLPFDERTGEADDSVSCEPHESCKIEVFNVIMDQVLQSIKSRFSNHRELYQDFSYLDPLRFKEFKKEGLPKEALESICKRMVLDSIVLREQLFFQG